MSDVAVNRIVIVLDMLQTVVQQVHRSPDFTCGQRHERTPRQPLVTPVGGDVGAAEVLTCHDARVEELEDGWYSGGRVLWKDFESGGGHYSIAGGPRGVSLWSQGNAGIDIPSAVIYALWSTFAGGKSRTYVVKVRRRRWGPIRLMVLRREFPKSKDLLECVKSVEKEVREGTTATS
jgi:hypothetical protein